MAREWRTPPREFRKSWTYEECANGRQGRETFSPGHSFHASHGHNEHVICAWCGAPNPDAPEELRVLAVLTW
jgi:hypothetical protein